MEDVHRFPAIVVCLVLGSAGFHAVEPRLSTRSLQEAVDIGQSRLEPVRAEFHKPYRIQVAAPPIDYIDVVTPFRRVVLAAEAQVRAGNRVFGQREALAALDATPEGVDLLVEMTFHPNNTFVGVPSYEVRLLARAAKIPSVDPRTIERVPRFGPRLPGIPLPAPSPNVPLPPAGGQPVIGGTLIAKLEGSRMDPRGVYDVMLIDARTVIAQGTVDFGRLR